MEEADEEVDTDSLIKWGSFLVAISPWVGVGVVLHNATLSPKEMYLGFSGYVSNPDAMGAVQVAKSMPQIDVIPLAFVNSIPPCTISGKGFTPNAFVNITLTGALGFSQTLQTQADNLGNILVTFVLATSLSGRVNVVAKDLPSTLDSNVVTISSTVTRHA